MLDKYLQAENLGENFISLKENVRSGVPTAVFGVQASEKYHLASMLGLPIIYITRDGLVAKNAVRELRALTGKKGVYLPAKDDVLLYNKAFNKDAYYERITAIYQLIKGVDFVTCTFESLLQLLPDKLNFIELKVDEEYDLTEFCAKLVKMGYTRVEEVDGKGRFSVRGDILHIFPVNYDSPVRIDFFGDTIEKMVYFGSDGKAAGETKKLVILPTTDFTIEPAEKSIIKTTLRESVRAFGTQIYASRARDIANELTEMLENDLTSPALAYILPLLSCMKGSIRKLMGEDAVVVYDECKLLNDSLQGALKEFADRRISLAANGESFNFTAGQYKTPEELFKELDLPRKLALQSLTSQIPFFNPLKTFRFNCTPVPRYALKPDDFFEDVRSWKITGYKVLVCCGNSERAARLHGYLEDRKIFSDLGDNFPADFSGVKITSYYLANGFLYHDAKLAVIGTNDLYSRKETQKKIKRKSGDVYYAPEVGDYCVHEKHGVGIVRGVKRITTTDSTKDYVAIEYRGGAILYVGVDRMDCLTKYMGGEEKPSLSKLGGQEFEKIKEKVKASIAKLTINLKQLYRNRREVKGFAFQPDDSMMREFEEAFPFEETDDQLTSIEEIKRDMESTRVMDRLLCGDVGYGKTEVALRAAFKAMESGKQVAFIAPTTILVEQHYMNALERFKNFPVRIAVLDRFRTSSEQTKTLFDLEDGKIDMVIGTHRLFSKDVKFKDLGLLILDEEQRFGVEHKEKLKTLKENVDTLTLSATPIPRTLHMSLTGIRDISIINTPPTQRIPVQIFVTEETDALIHDAINKELARGGQAFILYNSVESIYSFATRVRELIPEARIAIGHGQMPERQLEENVMAFYRGEYDVLIATTIIENGIDLPNANTLIVIDADKLGLSTLYQLKGRVGRSDRMARAYFTYKENKVITDVAFKRLSALTEFSDFGSGFKIAMRDLEIRGAGNVLGKEQHGHMEKIGYELYTKLLKEQLGEVTKNFETELDIGVSAFISEKYIPVESLRMDAYKQIAEISDKADEARVLDSLKSNYGELPAEVYNLIKIARLKALCGKFEVVKAELKKKSCRLIMKNLDSLSIGGIMDALSSGQTSAKLTFGNNPEIVFATDNKAADDVLDEMIKFLLLSCETKEKLD